jgi:hypothetical protein
LTILDHFDSKWYKIGKMSKKYRKYVEKLSKNCLKTLKILQNYDFKCLPQKPFQLLSNFKAVFFYSNSFKYHTF